MKRIELFRYFVFISYRSNINNETFIKKIGLDKTLYQTGFYLIFLPWEHIPDEESRVFGDRNFLYASHDNLGFKVFCDTKIGYGQRLWIV